MAATVAMKPERYQHPAESVSATFTHRQIMTILGGLMLGILLAALDQTIVSTAIRTIADDLHGLDLQAWATTAYLITATIATPLYGKLSDLYGRKPYFLTAISIFIVGSMLCTISTSMYELAAFRAVQGIGAGGLMSLAFAIIGDIVAPRERARYQGYFLAVFGTASVIGPLVGGGFAGASSILGIAGWRWVFLVNVPIAAIALVVVARVLNIPHTRREARIDWPGAVALTVAVVPVLLVAEQGRDWGWGSAGAVGCYLIATAGLIGFVVAERRIGDQALLPLRLLHNDVFSVTSASALVVGMGMFGGLVLIPLYLQIVKGASPTKSGLLLLPLMAGIMASSMISGQLTARTGRYKVFPLVGTALMAVALLMLSFRLGVDTSLAEVDVYMVVFGLGLGGCLQTLIMAVQNAVPPRDMGVATASATFFRQMGGTLGVAVFLSILFSTAGPKIADAFRTIAATPQFQSVLADPTVRANPANAIVFESLRGGGSANAAGVLQDSSFLQHIDPRLARPFLVGFSDAMDGVFLTAAVVMSMAFVILLFLRELPLRNESGIAALAAERAAETGRASAQEIPPRDQTVPSPPGVASHPVIYGQVTKDVATPLSGVSLTLTDLSGRQLNVTRSDTDGHYQLDAPGSGSYLVTCAVAAHQPGIALIAVADAAVRHNFVLPEAGASLSGTVRAAGSTQPIATAVVTLVDIRGDVVVTTTTGSDGRFGFSGIAQGLYTLTVAAPTLIPVALSVDIPAQGQLTQDIEVAVRTQLTGSVRTESTGAAVPEALTILLDSDGQVMDSVITGSDGRFVFDNLPAAVYTVVAKGYSAVATEVQLQAGRANETVITLPQPSVAESVTGNGLAEERVQQRAAGKHGQR